MVVNMKKNIQQAPKPVPDNHRNVQINRVMIGKIVVRFATYTGCSRKN